MIPIVPIIMAAATVANTIFQAKANSQNQENFNSQMQYNKDMQDAQNKYNLPTAQRQRYEDAGINPYLALSNITSGSQQSVMSAPPAPVNNPPQLDVPSLVNAITQFQVGMAQSALLRSQKKNQDIVNKYQDRLGQSVIGSNDANANKGNADADFTRGSKTKNTDAQTDLFNSQRKFVDTQDFWFPSVQNWTIGELESRVGYNNAKADESKAQKKLIDINTKKVTFDLNFAKQWQSKIVQSEIDKNYADAFAVTYNAKTSRMNAITSRLSVDQQANYIAALTMESYARYGKVKLETWQSKKMFKYVKAQAIKDIKKRQSEIDNLNSNTKKTDTERGFIPYDKGFNYAEQFTRILKNAFQLGGGAAMLFGK
ncbi:DNA pilot protein [Microvirus sp.]|nr:DNA pilot protein [Microvirus sp.]